MPTLNYVIDNFCIGDKKKLRIPLSDVEAANPIVKAWFTVKTTEPTVIASTPDSDSVFQKTITTGATAGQGQILDDGSDGNGAELFFELMPADTVLLTGGRRYYFDVQVLHAASATDLSTPLKGTIRGEAEITQRTS